MFRPLFSTNLGWKFPISAPRPQTSDPAISIQPHEILTAVPANTQLTGAGFWQDQQPSKISHLPRWLHFQFSSREKSGLESGRQVAIMRLLTLLDTASIRTQIPLQVSPTKRFQDFHCEWDQAFMIVLFGKAPKAYTNFRIYMSIHIYIASLSATNNAMRQRRTLWILETIPCHKLPPFSRGCWSYQVLVASSARVVLNTKMQASWPNCFNP